MNNLMINIMHGFDCLSITQITMTNHVINTTSCLASIHTNFNYHVSKYNLSEENYLLDIQVYTVSMLLPVKPKSIDDSKNMQSVHVGLMDFFVLI